MGRRRRISKVQAVSQPRKLWFGVLIIFSLVICAAAVFIYPTSNRTTATNTDTSVTDQRPTPQNLSTARPKAKISDPIREKDRDEWFAAAQLVVDRTQDPEAREILTYLREHSALARPHPDGAQILEAPLKEPWFSLVSFMPGDEKISSDIAPLMMSDEGAAAMADVELRMMTLRSNAPLTQVWKGIIFLHEGFHMFTYDRDNYDFRDVYTFCHWEMLAHSFENRLLEKLGGAAYAEFLDGQVKQMKAKLDAKGYNVGQATPGMDYHPEVATIFESSGSEYEKRLSNTQCWINAIFRMIDTYDTGDKEEHKALMLQTLYRKHELLPK